LSQKRPGRAIGDGIEQDLRAGWTYGKGLEDTFFRWAANAKGSANNIIQLTLPAACGLFFF
jgi:hypothetical protein